MDIIQEGTNKLPRSHDVSEPVYTAQTCQFARNILKRVGDKWLVLVVLVLQKKPRRFSDIKRCIEGISQRMLTLTLRSLERDGLVIRQVMSTTPPSVYYALTDRGHTLIEPVEGLTIWAQNHYEAILASQKIYDASH